jgi:hypothetical protein
MKKEYSMAIALLETATTAFSNAQKAAISVLKTVLRPVGEHGISLTPLDDLYDDEFVCLAEEEPFEFKPITLVRYNDKTDIIEVFVSEWDKEKKVVLADGHWIDIEEAHVDIQFLLEEVITNLEWADYYDED